MSFTPTNITTGTSKADVVTQLNANDDGIAAVANAALPKGGGTMTGNVVLAGAPSNALHPATKAYADAIGAASVPNTGDTSIAGIKTFSSIPVGPASDPTSGNQLARKTYVDQVATSVVFSSPKIAGFSNGNAITAYGEWVQINTTYVVKVECTFVKRTGMKYLRLKGFAKASAVAGWRVKLAIDSGASSGTATGTNTSYSGSTPEVNLTLDISALSDNTLHTVTVELSSPDGSTTASLREDICITQEPG